jgi:hypothetical protein
MAMAASGAVLVARGELRTRTGLVLEAIALRHQIAVLERNRTCRPCYPSLGSVALDLAVAPVAGMARQPDDRPARDGLALAPKRLVSDLGISITWSLARLASEDLQ